MMLSKKKIQRILAAIAMEGLADNRFKEIIFASWLVSRNHLGDSSASGAPLAKLLRSFSIPSPRVYSDFFTYGITIPFTPIYLFKIRVPLPPRLKDFQTHAYLYPILFDPSAPRDFASRVRFVLGTLGKTPQAVEAMAKMTASAIESGEIEPSTAIEITTSPNIFDELTVNELIHSLGDTSQPKGK